MDEIRPDLLGDYRLDSFHATPMEDHSWILRPRSHQDLMPMFRTADHSAGGYWVDTVPVWDDIDHGSEDRPHRVLRPSALSPVIAIADSLGELL